MTPSLTQLGAAGYLPVEIDLDAGTVVLGRLATRDFKETWYDDTATGDPPNEVATVDIRSFLSQGADLVPTGPLNLIGHVSRCGSTLLSNLLALRPGTMVLKEPDFVTDVVHRIALTTDPDERHRCAELVAGLLVYTCCAASSNERTAVVKVTSWTTPAVMACLDRRVDTTWLLQWRAAHDVVASNLSTAPSWGASTERGVAARRAVGLNPSPTDGVDLYASVWSEVVTAFARAPDSVRYRTLSYDDLVADKEACLLATEAWFGAGGGGLPAGYSKESDRYSKGGTGERFDGAGAHRRPELDPAVGRRVEELTHGSDAWLRSSTRRLT